MPGAQKREFPVHWLEWERVGEGFHICWDGEYSKHPLYSRPCGGHLLCSCSFKPMTTPVRTGGSIKPSNLPEGKRSMVEQKLEFGGA